MKAVILFFALVAILAPTAFAQECAACETIITMVEGWVASNSTEQQIAQYLENICLLVPGYTAVCDAIVSQGVAQIITWIKQNETPQTICTQLGLCSSTKIVPDMECSGCEDIIGYVEQWLENTNNQQDVVSAIEVVCTYMPGWESTCDAIIAAGVPDVVNWVETYENKTTVCVQLELCTGKKLPLPKSPEGQCQDCQSIVETIDNWVTMNASEETIASSLATACTLIPQWQGICSSVIKQEVPQIIKWVEASESSDAICTSLGLCAVDDMKSVKIN